ADSASWSTRRSSSVRSSPSSSTTRSMTVPSGRVVGSSRMRRPFSTRARRGLMRLLYGFPPWPARDSRGLPQAVDLLEPNDHLVPTGWHQGCHFRFRAADRGDTPPTLVGRFQQIFLVGGTCLGRREERQQFSGCCRILALR